MSTCPIDVNNVNKMPYEMFDVILCDGGSDSIKPNLLDSGLDLHAMQRVCSSLALDCLVFVADPGEGEGAAPNFHELKHGLARDSAGFFRS